MMIPDAKAAVDKEWDELHNLPVWTPQKFEKKRRRNSRNPISENPSPLRGMHGPLPHEAFTAGNTSSVIQRTSRALKRPCGRRINMQSRFPRTRRVRFSNDGRKISSTPYLSFPEWVMKQTVQFLLFTQAANWCNFHGPVVLLERIFIGQSLARLSRERKLRNSMPRSRTTSNHIQKKAGMIGH